MSSLSVLPRGNQINNIWQAYLKEQLLVPMLSTNGLKKELILISAHYICDYKKVCIGNGAYIVRIKLDDGSKYDFPTICYSSDQILECMKIINMIILGRLKITVNEWLDVYPEYARSFKLMEWKKR